MPHSDDIHQALVSALLDRARDKEATIRSQAIVALYRLQTADSEENEHGESPMEVIIDALEHDPNACVCSLLYTLEWQPTSAQRGPPSCPPSARAIARIASLHPSKSSRRRPHHPSSRLRRLTRRASGTAHLHLARTARRAHPLRPEGSRAERTKGGGEARQQLGGACRRSRAGELPSAPCGC